MNLNMQSVSRTAEAIEWASVPRENPQKRSFGRRAWACVLLMLIGLVFFTTADAAATYYVSSSSGSDANPGTQSAPWKTLAKVYNSRPLFKPGDSILLRRGDTWYEIFNIAHQAGVSGTPITYGTYGSGVLPTVDAQNARLFGVYMDNVSHIVVRDLRTINATADGFRIVAAMGNVSDIVVQGVISEKNTRDGFSVEARVGVTHVDALEYHDDVAHLNGRSGFHAYNVSDGATGIHYYGCKATYNGQLSANHGFSAFYANNIHYHEVEAAFTNIDPATGLSNGYTSEGIGISFDDYTNNSSVEHSYLHDNARTGLVLAHRGSNNTASYNVIASNGVYGLVVNGKTGSNNIQILNNTIYGNKGYGIQAWQPINGLAIKNNILVNNVGYGIGFSATGITNSTVAANLFFGNTHGTMSYVPGATGTIVADPAFTAPASRDFSLQASSPAINRGLYLGAPYQLGLKKGSIWPFTVLLQDQSLSWDIGSFVYTSGGPTPSTTVLVSSANPSLLGASVTFTASVTGVAPTGTVNFTDGGTSITGCAARSLSGSGNTRTGTCTTANLTSGPHSIVASYAGDAGSGASSSGVLFQVVDMSASTFSDVLTGYWAYAAIEAIAYNSITLGCASNPLRFCPDGDVRRDEMAVFVERATRGIGFSFAPTGVVFSDVPSTHWAVGPIEQFYHDGITKGCGVSPLRFCPHNSVTRAEIAIFLLRARFGAGYNPGESTGLVFSDVPATHWAAAWIEEFAARGYTTGCGMTPPRFCPDVVVTRAEMAVFLQRLFNLAGPPP